VEVFLYPLVPLSSSVSIPSYYLVISLTVTLALIWVVHRAKRFRFPIRTTLDLSLIIMVSGFLGARIFHILYENFDYYREDFVRVFYFWNGGFVFYGGALLAATLCTVYLLVYHSSEIEAYFDLFAPVLAFTYMLGRFGCFLAGCCYGAYCEVPWAISNRHPTQLYALLWELGTLIVLLALEKTKPWERKSKYLRKPGSVFYSWIILHGLGRFIMEGFRDDFRGPSLGLSISSWISLGLVAFGVWMLLQRPVTRRSPR